MQKELSSIGKLEIENANLKRENYLFVCRVKELILQMDNMRREASKRETSYYAQIQRQASEIERLEEELRQKQKPLTGDFEANKAYMDLKSRYKFELEEAHKENKELMEQQEVSIKEIIELTKRASAAEYRNQELEKALFDSKCEIEELKSNLRPWYKKIFRKGLINGNK